MFTKGAWLFNQIKSGIIKELYKVTRTSDSKRCLASLSEPFL